MQVISSEILPVQSAEDVVRIRQRARHFAVSTGFNLVEQTKLVTASSEIARNTLVHGRGGQATVEVICNDNRTGIRLTFEDQGPGIADIAKAMTDGYSTHGGMGLGLGGTKRLSHEFAIESTPEVITRVMFVRWKGL